MSPNLPTLLGRLKQSEGWRDNLYLDTTGNLTIGFGFNLAKLVLPPGVSYKSVRLIPVTHLPIQLGESWLTGLVLSRIEELNRALPWLKNLDPVRQSVLVDMAYNLGVPELMEWPIFLGQVQRGEFAAASENMLSTRWAHQVSQRANRLAEMMEHGS